jgi:hypothetical protein
MGISSNFNISKGITTSTVSNLIGLNITDDNTVSNTDISFASNNLVISNKSATGSLIFKTNNTTALTIASNGAVTFAGAITGPIDATNLTGTIATARLGSGTANSTTYLRGDNTWQTVTSGATITDDTTTNATRYLLFDDITTGASTSVGVSSSKLYYNPSTGQLNATKFVGDGSGLTGVGASTFTTTVQTATASQTTFNISYTVGMILVYQNGTRLAPSDFTATNGTTVVLGTGATAGDELMFTVYTALSVSSPTAYTETVQTATAGQTSFSITYTVGRIQVYKNGFKLSASDFTASNGTSVVLASAAAAGDEILFVNYSALSVSGALVPADIGATVQGTLVSGTSIKTINSTSLLGSGDIVVGTSVNAMNYFLSSF